MGEAESAAFRRILRSRRLPPSASPPPTGSGVAWEEFCRSQLPGCGRRGVFPAFSQLARAPGIVGGETRREGKKNREWGWTPQIPYPGGPRGPNCPAARPTTGSEAPIPSPRTPSTAVFFPPSPLTPHPPAPDSSVREFGKGFFGFFLPPLGKGRFSFSLFPPPISQRPQTQQRKKPPPRTGREDNGNNINLREIKQIRREIKSVFSSSFTPLSSPKSPASSRGSERLRREE